MEFLRFGSSIPGSYWGCCAMCIIQNFKVDPDEEASIQLVCGDGGEPLGDQWLGKTYREIFESRIRIGTFSSSDMPNHAFLATLTSWQVSSDVGKEWLNILYENGFEFIRAVDNSVYSGDELFDEEFGDTDGHLNYLFGLFRNIGDGKATDPFQPPKSWTDLSGGPKQAIDFLTDDQKTQIANSQEAYHLEQWGKLGPAKIYSQADLKEAYVPLTFAGQRSKLPQQGEEEREAALKAQATSTPQTPAPFADNGFAVDVVV